MDLILASKKADKIIMEVEGVGGYYGWSSSQFPLLSQKKLAAGLFLLQPHAFVQPYYSVSSKIAYVCQGTYDICFWTILSVNCYYNITIYIKKI